AAIGRPINAISNRDAVTGPRFTSADPNVLRVLRINRDRANGLHWLFVEDGPEGGAEIFRLPNAATGRTHENGGFAIWLMASRDCRNAATHGSRADVTGAQARNRARSKR